MLTPHEPDTIRPVVTPKYEGITVSDKIKQAPRLRLPVKMTSFRSLAPRNMGKGQGYRSASKKILNCNVGPTLVMQSALTDSCNNTSHNVQTRHPIQDRNSGHGAIKDLLYTHVVINYWFDMAKHFSINKFSSLRVDKREPLSE